MSEILNIEPSYALTPEEFATLSPVANLRHADLLAYDLPKPDHSLQLALSRDEPLHFDALPRPSKQSIGKYSDQRFLSLAYLDGYRSIEDIYKKSSTTYKSIDSVDSLALVANAVIQELCVIAPEVYSNLSYRGNARIRQVDGHSIINSLEPDLPSFNYEVKNSTWSNWRDEREIHITVNQEKRYRLLQSVKGVRAASLACLAPGGQSKTKTKDINNDEE